MRLLALFLTVWILFSCKTQKNDTQDYFQISKAYSQIWYGGQPGVQGTYYTLELKSLTSKNVVFDSLFIKNEWHPVRVQGEDPIVIKANVVQSKTKQELLEPETEDNRKVDLNVQIIRPDDKNTYLGKNTLAYHIGNDKHYIIIEKFDNEPAISYP